jgi:predicted HicB family RNase H-like nuclease
VADCPLPLFSVLILLSERSAINKDMTSKNISDDQQMNIRVAPKDLKALKELAKRDSRSLANWMRLKIQEIIAASNTKAST